MILNVLIYSNLIIPIITVIILCHDRRGFKIDHVFLFSIGYVYYWVIPMYVFEYQYMDTIYSEVYFARIFYMDSNIYKLKNTLKIYYLINILAIYIFFLIGEIIFRTIKFKRYIIKPFNIKALDILLYILIFIWLLLTIYTSNHYFRGYLAKGIPYKGSIIALNIFLLLLFHFKYTNLKYNIRFKNIFFTKYFFIYLMSAVFLVSLGNRTWVMCGVISFIVLYSNYYRRISFVKLTIAFIILAIFLMSYAYIRTGHTEISLNHLIIQSVWDPLAMHNGLKYYLVNYHSNLINIPSALLSQIITIIPTVLLPYKYDYVLNLTNIDIDKIQMQAAKHAFPILISHFGIIGTLLLSFLAPLVFNYLKNSIYLRASYIIMAAHITAPFFRDYDNYVIKIFLQMCILMPITYLFICNLFYRNK